MTHRFIETIARAACLEDVERSQIYYGLETIHEVVNRNWRDYVPMVVATIRSLLEPSAEMLVAAEEAVPALGSDEPKKKSPSYIAWQIMINTALSHAEEDPSWTNKQPQ